MPTNRTLTRRKSITGQLTDDERFFLSSGVALDGAPPDLCQDMARAELLWRAHGDALVTERQRRGWYFSRPWAWWRFQVGREILTGAGEEQRVLIKMGALTSSEKVRLGQDGRT